MAPGAVLHIHHLVAVMHRVAVYYQHQKEEERFAAVLQWRRIFFLF